MKRIYKSVFIGVLTLLVSQTGYSYTPNPPGGPASPMPNPGPTNSPTPSTLDTSFDTDGKVTTSVTPNAINVARALAIQPDGKILVAGSAFKSGSFTDFTLLRYNPDGSLDTTFGQNSSGIVTTDMNNNVYDYAYAIALQPDGKIVVAGTAGMVRSSFALARYTSGGVLDTTFNGTGKIVTPLGNDNAAIYGLAIDSTNGKIIAAGYSSTANVGYDFTVLRYSMADGSLDSSFGTAGVASKPNLASGYAYAIALQADGKIVVGGVSGFPGSFTLVRYGTNGMLDSTFNSTGVVTTSIGGTGGNNLISSHSVIYALAIDGTGNIVAGGSAVASSGQDNKVFALARYTSSGSLDTTFNSSGKVLTDFMSQTKNDAEIYALDIQSDGKIVSAGYVAGNDFNTGNPIKNFEVVRYNTNGLTDSNLTTELSAFNNSPFNTAYAVKVQADKKIVVAGGSQASLNSGNGSIAIARLMGDFQAGVSNNSTTFTLTPSPLDFGSQALASTSAAKTVTLTNTGANPLTLSTITIAGEFTQAGSSTCTVASPVAASATCNIDITFTPQAVGARPAGTLTVTSSNGTPSPATVSLTGSGSSVTPATCGNGVKDAGEECDPTAPGSSIATCSSACRSLSTTPTPTPVSGGESASCALGTSTEGSLSFAGMLLMLAMGMTLRAYSTRKAKR